MGTRQKRWSWRSGGSRTSRIGLLSRQIHLKSQMQAFRCAQHFLFGAGPLGVGFQAPTFQKAFGVVVSQEAQCHPNATLDGLGLCPGNSKHTVRFGFSLVSYCILFCIYLVSPITCGPPTPSPRSSNGLPQWRCGSFWMDPAGWGALKASAACFLFVLFSFWGVMFI